MKNKCITIFGVAMQAGRAISNARAVPISEAGNTLIMLGLAMVGVVLINGKYRHVLLMSKTMGRA